MVGHGPQPIVAHLKPVVDTKHISRRPLVPHDGSHSIIVPDLDADAGASPPQIVEVHFVAAHARPHGKKLATFGRRNENGFVTVFGVVGEVLGRNCAPSWYRVQLPMRPNGATGYVQVSDVVVVQLRTRIEVDLSSRRIQVFRAGRSVLVTRAGVGRPGTPTPTGRYYVNQLLLSDDPDGVFGPGGVGISAFAPRLEQWPQGGPIAIHGTDQPATIGRAASLGCLRVPNHVVRWFFRNVPAGTPVLIRS